MGKENDEVVNETSVFPPNYRTHYFVLKHDACVYVAVSFLVEHSGIQCTIQTLVIKKLKKSELLVLLGLV